MALLHHAVISARRFVPAAQCLAATALRLYPTRHPDASAMMLGTADLPEKMGRGAEAADVRREANIRQ